MVATATLGLTAAVATPAQADGVYVCWSWTEINNPSNGYTITYYPFPDGVQDERCSSQGGGGGAGADLPLGMN